MFQSIAQRAWRYASALFVVAALAGGTWTAAQQQAAEKQTAQKAQSASAQKQEAKKPAAQPAAAQPTAADKSAAAAGPDFTALMKPLKLREIGPATMGGRIDDFAVVESDPNIIYVGTASGGILKSVNSGTTWEPIFDNEAVSTIGDVTLAPSDPSIIWVGTGEPNNRQSSSWGNGVYRSTDAGKTWQHLGLAETHHIGRIVVHPRDPHTAYVAAVGKLWGASKERGVYKTTDGGKTWTHSLFLNEDTGAIDIAMDPNSPDTLIAAMYQRRRAVHGFNGSGPHGGLYKSTDGGATWKKLEKGLPWDREPRPAQAGGGGGGGFGGGMFGALLGGGGQQQQPQEPPAPRPSPEAMKEIGRIGVNFYRNDTNVVYALIEHAAGGIFRSDDKGETWTKMSDTNPRAMYYSKVHIDPNNDQRIWVHGANMYYSEDGGKTFRTNFVQRIHGDFHAMWINPADSDHIVLGSDGGIHISRDRGRTWDFLNNFPLGQFYEIGLDMSRPYKVCGGLQDNNTWCGPSATFDNRGISNDDWFTIGGGDGFYAQIDPTDPDIVYAESQDGNVLRRNLRTHEAVSIRPAPAEGEPRYRFQWNSPIVISQHDPKTIYYGGNFVFRSPDRGDAWERISPDLTSGVERDKLEVMGKVPDKYTLSRHDGVQQFPAISSLSESAINKDVLWAGTDDGFLHVTRDGGKNWKNVFPAAVPKGTYVSRVIASRHNEGTAYATFDGHRSNDFGIYVFMTTDFGATWKAIRNGIPDNNGVVNVIREHHRNPKLLVTGTEYGAYISFDQGGKWSKLKMNLPTVPVDDIAIHPRDNDLVLGTHGRSIWILDDMTPFEQMSDAVANSDVHLFDVRPATAWRTANKRGSTGHEVFLGPNPPNGALIHYYLKAKPGERERVRLTITDAAGKTVRDIQGTREQGINRVVWDLRARSPIPPATPPRAEDTQQPGGFGVGGAAGAGQAGQAGLRVEPGEYTVKLSFAGKEQSKKIVVEEDPRITLSAADRAARRKVLDQIEGMIAEVATAQRSMTALRTALNGLTEGWKRPNATKPPENVQKMAEEMLKSATAVCRRFASTTQCGERSGAIGSAGPAFEYVPPTITQRIVGLVGALEGYTAAPTAWQLDQLRILQGLLQEEGAKAKKLAGDDLAALNKAMNEAGVPHVALPPTARGGNQPPTREEEWEE